MDRLLQIVGGDAHDEFVSEHSLPRIITQYQGLLLSTRDYYSVPGIIWISRQFLPPYTKLSVSRPDDGFCLLSSHSSGSFPKGDGRECVFSQDNHKTASWVIDIEVIGLI